MIDMTLSQQVVSLELSRRLKTLGIKQQSFFAWSEVRRTGGTNFELIWPDIDEWEGSTFDSWVQAYAAFTTGELGALLPNYFTTSRAGEYGLYLWHCRASDEYLSKGALHQVADTQVDACAKMLIHLIEINLIII